MIRRGSLVHALIAWLAIISILRSAVGREARKPSNNSPLVIDINQASVEDFVKLPGIGPELAKRIVAYREKHGPFQRVEDLFAIRGIGPKKWKALRPHLQIGSKGRKPSGGLVPLPFGIPALVGAR